MEVEVPMVAVLEWYVFENGVVGGYYGGWWVVVGGQGDGCGYERVIIHFANFLAKVSCLKRWNLLLSIPNKRNPHGNT